MEASHYVLRCTSCGRQHDERRYGFALFCSCADPAAGLLRADYTERRFVVNGGQGLFRYGHWLPIRSPHEPYPAATGVPAGPVAYRSSELARHLGLDRLVVLYNGYWPERGADLESCSFKELEALAVTARLAVDEPRTLVVASAGNTGRAFHAVCSRRGLAAVVIVPQAALPLLWTTAPVSSAVTLVAVSGGADYADVIRIAAMVSELPGYLAEGGAHNVARRDGMGSVMLAGVERAGKLPRHYFQAVGSGTGAIAAWEMARRLVADGRFGGSVPHLHLAQNAPFTIMADAWEAGSRTLAPLAPTLAKRRIAAMRATVLSNRRPPYSLAGGVFDALSASAGSMYRVHNAEAERAAALFAETEGSDLDPAAAVAVAALRQAVAAGAVRRRDTVFLNVTGGGFQRLRAEGRARRLLPDLVVDHRSATPAALAELLAGACGAAALGSSLPYASALPPAGQAGGSSHAGREIA